MKPLSLLFILLILHPSSFILASVTDWPAGQFLMVDQHGSIVPSGYTAGLDEIAQAEAEAAATATAAALVTATAASASNTVSAVVDALTGAIGFAYVTGHTVSFAGAPEISTNASAQIVWCQFGAAGNMITNGVTNTVHYIWHVYSEEMNTTPAIKYKRVVDGTNAWEFAAYQSTAEFSNTNINNTAYAKIYRSTVWLPSSFDTAFFMAFCEINGGSGAGGTLDVEEGISIGGKAGYTGSISRGGKIWTYTTGLLMSVTNEVAQ